MHVVRQALTATAGRQLSLCRSAPLSTACNGKFASRQSPRFRQTLCATTREMVTDVSSNPPENGHVGQSAVGHQPVPKVAKRKVALFVAYVGSSFRGLQIQTKDPGGTVEDVLQQAIYEMGGILPSNYGTLQKVGWSRSSRTDKGVHALANVLAMKLECNPASFETDSEGTQLVAAMNARLPPEVRVLSVQRVNGGFNARGYCRNRTYHYYLPASILGLKETMQRSQFGSMRMATGNDKSQAQMALLRECCHLYQGNNPFHNYTKRKLYRLPAAKPPEHDWRNSRATKDAAAALQRLQIGPQHEAEAQAAVIQQAPAASGNVSEDDEWEVGSTPQLENGNPEVVSQRSPTQEAGSDKCQDAAAVSEQMTQMPRPLQYSCWHRWQDEMDPRDMLARAHYRYINDITVHDPEPLGLNQTLAVKVAITGSSFMLHQIQHMMGAAVAVARGNLPLDFVAASLCAPARTALPLAPSQVLVLADNSFQPFPSDTTPASAALHALSGEVLQLREHGLKARDAFEQEVLNPALEGLLQDSVWAEWDEKLNMLCWEDQDMAQFAQKADTWRKERAVIASAKKQQISEKQHD